MNFETRAALFTWLEAQGLTHVARFNLEAVAPSVDPSLIRSNSHGRPSFSIVARTRS